MNDLRRRSMNRVKITSAAMVAVGIAAALSGCGPDTVGYYVGAADAVSADGTTVLVAAPGAAHGKGAAVYVYHVSDAGSWASSSTPAATLTNKGGRADDEFGVSVALSADGTTAFVGAPNHGGGDGAVYVFHVSNEDAWASSSTPTARLTGGLSTSTGAVVAASPDGTTLVAGAPDYNRSAGGAYVFHVASEDAWVSSSTPTAALSNAGESSDDSGVGGDAVAISGDGTTALLSDHRSSDRTGGAYLFHVPSEAGWASSSAPTAILTNAKGATGDELGDALALSGDGTTAFLGAYGVHGGKGAVDVFQAAGEGAWASSSAPIAILTNALGSRGDHLGYWVAASADGTTVMVTAPDVHRDTGAAYVFHVADEGAWTSNAAPTAKLTDSSGARSDLLGLGLGSSADGATVLVGAPGVKWNTGAADVFHVPDASSWITGSTPTARLTNAALPHLDCVVPRIVGLRLSLAKARLRHAQCSLGRVRKVHSKTKKGRVVSQNRAPGIHIAPGSYVNVKVGK
jgi:hypothetical protein